MIFHPLSCVYIILALYYSSLEGKFTLEMIAELRLKLHHWLAVLPILICYGVIQYSAIYCNNIGPILAINNNLIAFLPTINININILIFIAIYCTSNILLNTSAAECQLPYQSVRRFACAYLQGQPFCSLEPKPYNTINNHIIHDYHFTIV